MYFSFSKFNLVYLDMDSSAMLFNQLKTAEPFFLLAGPNVIESEEHVLRMANHIKAITSKLGLPLVFKSSFDKANRTSSKSFRGPGLDQGLKILEKVQVAYDIPIVTDVHESIQCEAVGKVADIIQIPAFLCRQTDLLVATACWNLSLSRQLSLRFLSAPPKYIYIYISLIEGGDLGSPLLSLSKNTRVAEIIIFHCHREVDAVCSVLSVCWVFASTLAFFLPVHPPRDSHCCVVF
ncbi:hypothetical protein HYC85_011327 [Camellia sinensis]|uniref:3-deoxy-8-phosphooctulonate synthase n=1 Tax=Camellia sinensis TaxID=4442 RepID=A0A7J7HBS6_CAMSI|nr:hypothetical protein HYC85_011327 [Camellia sinensis]